MQTYINAGLPKAKAESSAKNEKLACVLDKIISNAAITDASKNPKQGNLLLHLATSASPQELPEEDTTMLAKMIADGSIQSLDQLNGELVYLNVILFSAHPSSCPSSRRHNSSQSWR